LHKLSIAFGSTDNRISTSCSSGNMSNGFMRDFLGEFPEEPFPGDLLGDFLGDFPGEDFLGEDDILGVFPGEDLLGEEP